MSVNVPAVQLRGDDFVQQVAGPLDRHQLPSQHLTLEIDETVRDGETETASGVLADLRKLDLRIAIDNFCMGDGQTCGRLPRPGNPSRDAEMVSLSQLNMSRE
jgi:EAL domain-containing protein (putative c-di-GMP-specific phosphodiesterase class I)